MLSLARLGKWTQIFTKIDPHQGRSWSVGISLNGFCRTFFGVFCSVFYHLVPAHLSPPQIEKVCCSKTFGFPCVTLKIHYATRPSRVFPLQHPSRPTFVSVPTTIIHLRVDLSIRVLVCQGKRTAQFFTTRHTCTPVALLLFHIRCFFSLAECHQWTFEAVTIGKVIHYFGYQYDRWCTQSHKYCAAAPSTVSVRLIRSLDLPALSSGLPVRFGVDALASRFNRLKWYQIQVWVFHEMGLIVAHRCKIVISQCHHIVYMASAGLEGSIRPFGTDRTSVSVSVVGRFWGKRLP